MHYLCEYQTFDTTEQLNAAVYAHIKRNSYDLNETERAALKAIARYAVKFAGAAHLKAETLAELIGKSAKTARRAVLKLAELGIVRKVATTRKVSGGKGANILQILPVVDGAGNKNNADVQSNMSNRGDAEEPTETSVQLQVSENEPSNFNKRSVQKHLSDTAVPSTALKGALPSEIYDAMARYFDAEEMYKYYGILIRAKASVDPTVMIEDDAAPFVQTWHSAIHKLKRGKLRSLADYLYVAWRQSTHEALRRKNADRMRGAWDAWMEA